MHYSDLLYLRLVLIAHDYDQKSVQFHAQKKSLHVSLLPACIDKARSILAGEKLTLDLSVIMAK